MIDTHLHLDQLPDPEAQLDEALAAGVEAAIAVGVDAGTSQVAVEWSERRPQVWAAVGHHPLSHHEPDLARLGELAGRARVVAIGEVGLDEADPERAPSANQDRWFHACLGLAEQAGLPVVVHVRESAGLVLEALRRHPSVKGVIHYWSLEWEWAERFLDLGFYLSFSGLVTRTLRGDLREVAARMPADRLLIETDAPWGTPRGRVGPMRAAWIKDTLEVVARARALTPLELSELEWANALRLFGRLRR